MIDVPHSIVSNLWKTSTVFVVSGRKHIDSAPDSTATRFGVTVDNIVENFGVSKKELNR